MWIGHAGLQVCTLMQWCLCACRCAQGTPLSSSSLFPSPLLSFSLIPPIVAIRSSRFVAIRCFSPGATFAGATLLYKIPKRTRVCREGETDRETMVMIWDQASVRSSLCDGMELTSANLKALLSKPGSILTRAATRRPGEAAVWSRESGINGGAH